MREIHSIPPIFDADSKLIILGSFPSKASRETAFFYGHAQNRFWNVLAAVFSTNSTAIAVPDSIEEKRAFLHAHSIAVWDVIAECDINGSADSSISNVIPNDIKPILSASKINRIYVNGRLAQSLYEKFMLELTGQAAIYLPSTSPANAQWSLEQLTAAWSVIAKS